MSTVEPGCKVRVVNPEHWLYDRVGHVVAMTIAAHLKKAKLGVGPTTSIGVPVDFEQELSGWMDSSLGRRKRLTHDCDGALKRPTGYYILARELELLDIPGKGFKQRSGGDVFLPR